jgi:alcohol dehydrogenase, propanol-preferring
LTHGHGVTAAFDSVGFDATLSLAIGATRALGKVTQVGLAGGAARLKVLDNSAFEVTFEATLWGTIKELREVPALAESGRLSPIPLQFEPLDRVNEVYARVKKGEVNGRVVIVKQRRHRENGPRTCREPRHQSGPLVRGARAASLDRALLWPVTL